jgi:hypothetical protein
VGETAGKVVGAAATLAAGAAILGLGHPLEPVEVTRTVYDPYSTQGQDIVASPGIKLGGRQTGGRNLPPGAFGVKEDETLFANYEKKRGLLYKFTMNTSQTSGELLAAIKCDPWVTSGAHTVTNDTATETMHVLPPISYIGTLLRMWRGDLIYEIEVIKTNFHNGKVWVCWSPGSTSRYASTSLNAMRLQNYVRDCWDFSAEESTKYTAHIDFSSHRYMEERSVFTSIGSGGETSSTCANGHLFFIVESPLKCASEIVQTSITFEVYIRGSNSIWADPSECITRMWRGPDFVGAAHAVKEEEEDFLKLKLGSRKAIFAQAGNTLPLRSDTPYLTTTEGAGRFWRPLIKKGNPDVLAAAVLSNDSLVHSFLQLMKRPHYLGNVVPGAVNTYTYRPGFGSMQKAILATFGWAAGDEAVHFVFQAANTPSSSVCFYNVPVLRTGAAIRKPLMYMYKRDVARHPECTLVLASMTTKKFFATTPAEDWPDNPWRINSRGFVLEAGLSGNVPSFTACPYVGDNFVMGCQLSPPFVVLDSTDTSEDYDRMDDPNSF